MKQINAKDSPGRPRCVDTTKGKNYVTVLQGSVVAVPQIPNEEVGIMTLIVIPQQKNSKIMENLSL